MQCGEQVASGRYKELRPGRNLYQLSYCHPVLVMQCTGAVREKPLSRHWEWDKTPVVYYADVGYRVARLLLSDITYYALTVTNYLHLHLHWEWHTPLPDITQMLDKEWRICSCQILHIMHLQLLTTHLVLALLVPYKRNRFPDTATGSSTQPCQILRRCRI